MKRFTNILVVPVADSTTVPPETSQAVDLAVENGARLTVFGVVPQPSRAERLLHLGRHSKPMSELLEAGVTSMLSSWSAQFADRADIDVVVSDGHQPIEIVRAVIRSDIDLVVMATDGSDDARTTVKRVLRKCPCPVWVVRPGYQDGPVVAAVDPDDDPGLNSLILELAASQSQRRKSDLHVVHAWQFHGESLALAGEFTLMGGGAMDQYRKEVEFAHREALDELLAFVELEPHPTVHLVEDRPVRAIEALGEQLGAGLLVMGAVGRSGVDGLLMGNSAERVLGGTDCSVVVIKPPGFVSPVDPSRGRHATG